MPPLFFAITSSRRCVAHLLSYAFLAFTCHAALVGSHDNSPQNCYRLRDDRAVMIAVRLHHPRHIPYFVNTLRQLRNLAGPCSRVTLAFPDAPRIDAEHFVVMYNASVPMRLAINLFRQMDPDIAADAAASRSPSHHPYDNSVTPPTVRIVATQDVRKNWPQQIRAKTRYRTRNALTSSWNDFTLDTEQTTASAALSSIKTVNLRNDNTFYSNYHVYDDHIKMWNSVVATFPDVVRLEIIGNSSEQRPIVAVRIGPTTESTETKQVVITGLLHAREWISAAVTTYMVHHLAADAAAPVSEDNTIRDLLKQVQVVVIPIVNPDGYVYSGKVDRFWRKNTRVVKSSALTISSDCFGVDLNRNWDVDFGGVHATSRDPCDETYIGPRAFSEPETAAVKAFVDRNTNIVSHLDIHSFGQFVLGPWAFTNDPPPRADKVDRFGNAIARSISAKHGQKYLYGRGDSLLYLSSGTCSDWFYDQGAVSATIEVRPDNSTLSVEDGFQLAKSEILPTCEELYAGLLGLLQHVTDSKSDDTSDGSNRRKTIIWSIVAIVTLTLALILIIFAICFIARRRRRRHRKSSVDSPKSRKRLHGNRAAANNSPSNIDNPQAISSGNAEPVSLHMLATTDNDHDIRTPSSDRRTDAPGINYSTVPQTHSQHNRFTALSTTQVLHAGEVTAEGPVGTTALPMAIGSHLIVPVDDSQSSGSVNDASVQFQKFE